MQVPSEQPDKLEFPDQANIRAAMSRAKRIYSEPVATLIEQEMRAWMEMGYRFGAYGLMARLIKSIMSSPIPEDVPEAAHPRTAVGPRVPKPRITIHTPLPKPVNDAEVA